MVLTTETAVKMQTVTVTDNDRRVIILFISLIITDKHIQLPLFCGTFNIKPDI